jgi:hypothetical protein
MWHSMNTMGMIWLPEGSTVPRALNEIVARPSAWAENVKDVDGIGTSAPLAVE